MPEIEDYNFSLDFVTLLMVYLVGILVRSTNFVAKRLSIQGT